MLNIEKYKDEILEGWKETNNLEIVLYRIVSQYNYCCTKEVQIKWLLSEYDEPPLTLEEHEYLETALKPFHENIECISKAKHGGDEYLIVRFEDGFTDDFFFFPSFKEGAMYKGMMINKEYTLQELGITYED